MEYDDESYPNKSKEMKEAVKAIGAARSHNMGYCPPRIQDTIVQTI